MIEIAALVLIFGITELARSQRRRDAIEVPITGAMHFKDGAVRQIMATSPFDAIDRVIDRSRPLVDQRR